MDGKKKRKGADCGCNAAHSTDDGGYAADVATLDADADVLAQLVGDFAVIEVDEDAADLHPDPRGDEVRTWRGLIAPYVAPTGDGRRFALGSLSARDLPLPVKWQRVDSQGHSTSVVVGRIDGIDFQEDGEDPKVEAWGIIFDPDADTHPSLARLKQDADEAWYLLQQKTIGPSVDLDDMAYQAVEPEEGSEFAAQGKQEIEVTKGRVSAITLVQIPAFAQARPFALSMTKAADYAEMTAVTASGVAEGLEELTIAIGAEWDALAWIEAGMPEAGALYASGGLGAFPVAAMVDGELKLIPGAVADAVSALAYHDAEIELGEGTKAAMRAQLETLTAACGLPTPPWTTNALVASGALPPAELFADPKFAGPTPISIKRVGEHLHYSGHVATWGTCHIGFPGQCITAPRSRSNYAHFHLGSTATDKGRIATGKISIGGGHADLHQGFRAALEHYDSTSTAAVDVRAGEDAYGIWVSGVVRPTVAGARLEELASAPLSGDWRRVGSHLEMVAALAVNTPGFPIPHMAKARGQELALVAAGSLSTDARQKAASKGEAMPDGSFPIRNLDELGKAIKLWGQAKNPDAAKRFIIKRAKELGATDQLPADWRASGAHAARAAVFADAGSFDRLDQRARQLAAARAFL